MGTRTMVVLLAVAGAVLGLSGCGGAGADGTQAHSSPSPSGSFASSVASAAVAPAEFTSANQVRAALGDACVKDPSAAYNLRHFPDRRGVLEVVCSDQAGKTQALLYGWDGDATFKVDGIAKITQEAQGYKQSNSPHACIVTSTKYPWALSFPFYENYSIPPFLQQLVDEGKAVKSVGDCQAG